jgi:hypothetical protein
VAVHELFRLFLGSIVIWANKLDCAQEVPTLIKDVNSVLSHSGPARASPLPAARPFRKSPSEFLGSPVPARGRTLDRLVQDNGLAGLLEAYLDAKELTARPHLTSLGSAVLRGPRNRPELLYGRLADEPAHCLGV